jgi:hypothetical protein
MKGDVGVIDCYKIIHNHSILFWEFRRCECVRWVDIYVW